MSKLRPVDKNCIYVIPDIHGMYDQLCLIFDRILPLRKSDGGKDKLILLGDYVDRNKGSAKVIDLLIKVKKDFPEQTFFIRGNHEYMFMDAIQSDSHFSEYNRWMNNGGLDTLKGYMELAGYSDPYGLIDPFLLPRNQILSLIPKEHIHFIKNLLPYYEMDKFIFVHGGCDPFIPLHEQNPLELVWDRSVYNNLSKNPKIEMSWEKLIITGHNCTIDGKIFLSSKFWMIDASSIEKLYLFEVTSKVSYSASKGNQRLVKEKFSKGF